jgi:hypothetical protein
MQKVRPASGRCLLCGRTYVRVGTVLQEMFKTRLFSAELSIGCFDNDRLAGFVVTGYRLISNKKVCYDIATGVIKEYQNKEI